MELSQQKTILCRKLRRATVKKDYQLMRELVTQIDLIQAIRNSLVTL